eukprot:15358099-Ditylum_brightwellii.AAC.1
MEVTPEDSTWKVPEDDGVDEQSNCVSLDSWDSADEWGDEATDFLDHSYESGETITAKDSQVALTSISGSTVGVALFGLPR